GAPPLGRRPEGLAPASARPPAAGAKRGQLHTRGAGQPATGRSGRGRAPAAGRAVRLTKGILDLGQQRLPVVLNLEQEPPPMPPPLPERAGIVLGLPRRGLQLHERHVPAATLEEFVRVRPVGPLLRPPGRDEEVEPRLLRCPAPVRRPHL